MKIDFSDPVGQPPRLPHAASVVCYMAGEWEQSQDHPDGRMVLLTGSKERAIREPQLLQELGS